MADWRNHALRVALSSQTNVMRCRECELQPENYEQLTPQSGFKLFMNRRSSTCHFHAWDKCFDRSDYCVDIRERKFLPTLIQRTRCIIAGMEGECLCHRVKVKVNDDDLFGTNRRGHICHCKNCRKVAGGIFGTNLTIEEEKVEFPNGKDSIKRYDVSCTTGSYLPRGALTRPKDPETLSGTPVQRYFCENCGVYVSGGDGETYILTKMQTDHEYNAPLQGKDHP